MKPAHPTRHTITLRSLAAAACTALAFAGGAAQAENHALIMWLGEYADPSNNLPGIDKDASLARRIARSMGVADANIIEAKNRELTLDGMKQAVGSLTSRIQSGDRVFLYYSGHGGQIDGEGGKCSEGMVSHDARLYFDRELQADLDKLATKAAQVIFMNDSCFSGGAATKDAKPAGGVVAKNYAGAIKSGSSNSNGYVCGEAINKLTRNLTVRANQTGTQFLYIAASSEREVSFASPQGSIATVAWAQCLEAANTDTNRDGLLSGDELRQCAQQRIGSGGRLRQTITVSGNTQMPVSFVAASASAGAAQAAPVQPEQTLESIRAAADPSMALTLNLSQQRLSISRGDKLDFSVSSPQAGYLYLLHIGSDGKTFDVLFPNDIDSNNYVNAGTHRFPRPNWAVQATGPEGTGYVMAYLSNAPKNFRAGMGKAGPFATTPANVLSAAKLGVVAVGGGEAGGARFGASAVVPVTEVR
jgi:hypothetical protein